MENCPKFRLTNWAIQSDYFFVNQIHIFEAFFKFQCILKELILVSTKTFCWNKTLFNDL